MPKLGLNRQQLASFLKNPEAIRAFEQLFDFQSGTPSTIEEAAALAGTAAAIANQALALVTDLAGAIEQLATQPPVATQVECDDFTPVASPTPASDDFTPPGRIPVPVSVPAAATDLTTVIALANGLRAALITNEIAQ